MKKNFPQEGFPQGESLGRDFMQDAMYRKWWFWAGLVVLGFGLWWGAGYYEFLQDTAESRQLGQDAAEYWQQLEDESEALEEAYRNDPYGGETPEETLALFVEALEAKDFELAAKYFVVEERENALRENRLGEEGGGNAAFISAYKNGRLVPPDGVGASGIYELEVFPVGEDIAYAVRFIKNEFTGKWKILEL